MKKVILSLVALSALALPSITHATGEVLERNQPAAGKGNSADNSRIDTRTGKQNVPDTVSSSNPGNPQAPVAPGSAPGYTPAHFKKRMGTPVDGTVADMSIPAQGNTPWDELERSSGVSVIFPAGQATLSEDAKKQIDGLLSTAQIQGDVNASAAATATATPQPKVESIKVVGWSDNNEAATKKSLSKEDQKLAAARATSIEEYIKPKIKNTKVTAYNMAKKPGVFSEVFNKNNTRLRKQLGMSAISVDGKGTQAMLLLIMKK